MRTTVEEHEKLAHIFKGMLNQGALTNPPRANDRQNSCIFITRNIFFEQEHGLVCDEPFICLLQDDTGPEQQPLQSLLHG
uniref:Uncharacterized protein n=1 Tax=Oryza rufipogon TaxID=4529 RepID=A0A0E0Q3F5_ORYRU